MAVVPITAAKGPSAEPQSDTDMAIAAALLHREGKFTAPSDDTIQPLSMRRPRGK